MFWLLHCYLLSIITIQIIAHFYMLPTGQLADAPIKNTFLDCLGLSASELCLFKLHAGDDKH